MSIKESFHFVARESVPVLDRKLRLREALDALREQDRMSFIVRVAGNDYYVVGNEFVNGIIASTQGRPARFNAALEQTLESLIDARAEEVIEVERSAMDVHDDPQQILATPDYIIARVEEDGEQVGWFLNHETFMATVMGRIVYICEKGHENTDPDSGTCYECPFPIVRSETRGGK